MASKHVKSLYYIDYESWDFEIQRKLNYSALYTYMMKYLGYCLVLHIPEAQDIVLSAQNPNQFN